MSFVLVPASRILSAEVVEAAAAAIWISGQHHLEVLLDEAYWRRGGHAGMRAQANEMWWLFNEEHPRRAQNYRAEAVAGLRAVIDTIGLP